MIWGASFAALVIILLIMSLIQFILLRRSLRKNPPDFPLPLNVNSGESFSVPLEVFIPFVFPGFRVVWRSRIHWKEGSREVTGCLSIGRGTRLYSVRFDEALRGIYRGISGTLVLEDLFGFTSFSLYKGEPVTLYVYPKLNGGDFEREAIITGGETATDEIERKRSDDLLEARKYYPGDDARRINWKMYAATGEMFLRIGEEIPPPSGETTLCLLADSPILGSGKFASTATDWLIDTLLALVRRFTEKGCRVHVLVSLKTGRILYDPQKPDLLLKELAGVSPSDSPPKIPEKEFLYATVHPGSSSLETLLRVREAETRLFLLSPKVKSRSMRLHNLLFRTGEKAINLSERKRENRIIDAVNEDMFSIKKEGRGRVHADLV